MEEFKDWPLELCTALGRFFNLVELRGGWPQSVRYALVAMLAKEGTGRVDDFRPIVLLSVVYRLWAKGHGRRLRAWLVTNGVLKPVAAGSADIQAYELALKLAEARLDRLPISGLAIDWSKCYHQLGCAGRAGGGAACRSLEAGDEHV